MKRKAEKIKSIMILLLAVSVYALFAVAYIQSIEENTQRETQITLSEVTKQSAQVVKTQIEGDLQVIKTMATFIGSHEEFELSHAMPILQKEADLNTFKRMGIILPDGTAHTTDAGVFDFSQRDYFHRGMEGETNISDVLVDIVDGKLIIVYATPIYHKGTIAGVLLATHNSEIYENLLTTSSFEGEGYSYISSSDGSIVVMSTHPSSVTHMTNILDELESTQGEGLLKKNPMKEHMRNGVSGNLFYFHEGIEKHLSYEPVGVKDWYIHMVVPAQVVSANANYTISATIIVTVFTILIFTWLLAYIWVSQRKNQKELEKIAFTDRLTGYTNWHKFELDTRILLTENPEKEYAYVLFDIDRFKIINDMFGHEVGNQTLKFVADVLENQRKNGETFSRISSDNFSILMTYELERDIIQRISKIVKVVERYNEGYRIVLSFGIYKIFDRDLAISVMNDRANLVKQTIKYNVEIPYAFYNDEMRNKVLKEKEIENNMEEALKNQEFHVYLQPKYSFADGSLVGAEALVRWIKADQSMIFPPDFIPLFEKNGFVKKIDYHMLESVCQMLSRWKNRDVISIPISVNFSKRHLENKNFVQDLVDIINHYGIEASQIEIELTESILFADKEGLLKMIYRMRQEGFKISIDDFGSGYSSLSLLKDIPADVLKIDKGFLEKLSVSEKGKRIIENIIRMAKDLDLIAVAEGVETEEEANYLKGISCDIAQGYYYAKPMPISAFEKLLSHKE